MSLLRQTFDLPKTPKDRLIFALDVDHIDEATQLIEQLAGSVGMFKIGPRLFTSVGQAVIDLVHEAGSSVFLDLKLHDIPASVAAAAAEIARQRIRMFTVHSMGGARMIRQLSSEISQMTLIPGATPPICLGVTVLTSHSQDEIDAIGFHEPIVDLAERLAKLAVENGAQGVVASGHELARLKEALPAGTVFVTPGIRGAGDAIGDQTRVMTAGEAIAAGASYLVVGRPIRQAADPVAAAERIVEEIAQAEA